MNETEWKLGSGYGKQTEPRFHVVAFDYGEWQALGVRPDVPPIMFDEFARNMNYGEAAAARRTQRNPQ